MMYCTVLEIGVTQLVKTVVSDTPHNMPARVFTLSDALYYRPAQSLQSLEVFLRHSYAEPGKK
jgi:hypothetical protein